jgi:hypothetical protein
MTKQITVSNNYDDKVHLVGIVTTSAVVLAFLAVPLVIQMLFGLEVDPNKTFVALASALAVFAPIAICEFISYVPILGAGAQYLSFVTGNVMNMKLPVAKNSQKICGVEAGTPEAEVVSTIGVAVSSIVTTVILFLGMVLIAQIAPLLSKPEFKPAFDNIMPAILSPLAIPAFLRAWKIAAAPVVIGSAITLIFGYATIAASQNYLLIVFLIISVSWAYLLYKRQQR